MYYINTLRTIYIIYVLALFQEGINEVINEGMQ